MKLNPDIVPGSFEDAVSEVRKALDEKDKKQIINCGSVREAAIAGHHSVGRHLRNAWSLWDADSPLLRDLKSKGLFHADDMSTAIVMAAVSPFFNETFDMDRFVAETRSYWMSHGIDPDTGQKLP